MSSVNGLDESAGELAHNGAESVTPDPIGVSPEFVTHSI